MKCNHCGKEFGDGLNCQYCGIDRVEGLGSFYGLHPNLENNPLLSNDTHTGSMICFNCNEIIPNDAEYCPYCRAAQYVACPKCGFHYLAQFPNCYKCGTNREDYIKKKKVQESELPSNGIDIIATQRFFHNKALTLHGFSNIFESHDVDKKMYWLTILIDRSKLDPKISRIVEKVLSDRKYWSRSDCLNIKALDEEVLNMGRNILYNIDLF